MAEPLGRRVPRDDLLPRVPDRRVPAAGRRARRRSPSRVAEMLGVSRASAGEMLKRLEAEGLVERGEHKEALLTEAGPRARRAGRAQAPDHRAAAHRLHGLHGRRGARARRRARRHVHRRHGRADRRAARPPRPLPARLAGRPRLRAGREPRARAAVGRSSRASARRSSGSPSTTATSCTGSTTRASCPAPRVELAARRAGRGPVPRRASTAARRRSARRPPPASCSSQAACALARSRPSRLRRVRYALCRPSPRLRAPAASRERVGLVGALPREVVVVAAEVAVRGGLRVDRPAQVEVAQDRRRAQVEVLAHELLDPRRPGRAPCRTSRRGSRTGARRRSRTRPGSGSGRRARRRRRSSRRSARRTRPSGRPSSGPCRRTRRRRAAPRRRRCRR